MLEVSRGFDAATLVTYEMVGLLESPQLARSNGQTNAVSMEEHERLHDLQAVPAREEIGYGPVFGLVGLASSDPEVRGTTLSHVGAIEVDDAGELVEDGVGHGGGVVVGASEVRHCCIARLRVFENTWKERGC